MILLYFNINLLHLLLFLLNMNVLLDTTILFDVFLAFLHGSGSLFSLETIVVAESLSGECNYFDLDLLEDVPNDWFWVEAIDLVIELSMLIVDGSVREGADLEFLTQTGVPVAIEVVDGE